MNSGKSELVVKVRQSAPVPLAAELRCPGGQLLALVGPSGSGKTTLLRTIAGLYRVSEGVIECGAHRWFDSGAGSFVPARYRRVGYVPQHFSLFPHMSVLHNVMAGMDHKPPATRAALAHALLDRVNLGGLEARMPNQLSGGQQQRVAVARALARDPDVLLLDEPFSAVDRSTRERLYGELAALKQGLSMPMVMVTHDLNEALLLADRMTVLHRGRTLQCGEPHAVVSRPDTEDVARLVGIRNIFSGTVIAHRQEEKVTLLQFGNHALETIYRPELPVGQPVSWVIPSEGVILHRRDRPSLGERENPLHGRIVAVNVLGEITRLALALNDNAQTVFWFDVPSHVARRNDVGVDKDAAISLRAEAIHVLQAG